MGHEVFKSAKKDIMNERFSSGGKFTSVMLDSAEDLKAVEKKRTEPELTEEDKRPLYDKLKETADLKEEEWQEAHKFKNQMSHWKLDEDDANFEEEHQTNKREAMEKRMREDEEDRLLYEATLAARTKPIVAPAKKPVPKKDEPSAKRKKASAPVMFVVKASAPKTQSGAKPPQASETQEKGPTGLSGLVGYSSSDDNSD